MRAQHLGGDARARVRAPPPPRGLLARTRVVTADLVAARRLALGDRLRRVDAAGSGTPGPAAPRWPRTSGTGRSSRTSRARWRISLPAMLAAPSSSTWRTSTGPRLLLVAARERLQVPHDAAHALGALASSRAPAAAASSPAPAAPRVSSRVQLLADEVQVRDHVGQRVVDLVRHARAPACPREASRSAITSRACSCFALGDVAVDHDVGDGAPLRVAAAAPPRTRRRTRAVPPLEPHLPVQRPRRSSAVRMFAVSRPLSPGVQHRNSVCPMRLRASCGRTSAPRSGSSR